MTSRPTACAHLCDHRERGANGRHEDSPYDRRVLSTCARMSRRVYAYARRVYCSSCLNPNWCFQLTRRPLSV